MNAQLNRTLIQQPATLWDDRPARPILRRCGFRAGASQGSVIELDLELDSPSVTEWRHGPQAPNSTLQRQRGAATDPMRRQRPFQHLTREEPHGKRS